MIRPMNITLITLALAVWVSTSHAQTLLFEDAFPNPGLPGWTTGGSGLMTNISQQLVRAAACGPLQTNNPMATHFPFLHSLTNIGPLPDDWTLEGRADLISANQNDAWASVHFLWNLWNSGQGYVFYKDQDEIALMKFWNGGYSSAWFFYEQRPLKNTNVTLVLAFTRRGSNLEIRTRVLDKDYANLVLYDRTVIDTPQADPVLPNRSVRGVLSTTDTPGLAWPLLGSPNYIEGELQWANPDRPPAGTAQVIYDNFELWQYYSPRPYVLAWGADFDGETFVPSGLSNVLSVAAGGGTSLALRADGKVIAWGLGATNYPSGLSNIVAIGAGSSTAIDIDIAGCHALMLRADGTVAGWGNTTTPGGTIVPAGLSNVVAVAAGAGHSLALRTDGSVVAWGGNYYGESDVPPDLTNAVAVAAGWSHSVALRADGTVAAWGDPGFGVTEIPMGLSNVVAIAAGFEWSLALRVDGTVVAWGRNESGECNVPTDVTNIVAVASGPAHNLALSAQGRVVAWPRGAYSPAATEVPNGLTNVMAVVAGSFQSLALIGDGPPVVQASLSHPTMTADGFSVSVPTQSGHVYRLEYKNSLAETNWTALPLAAGTGRGQALADPTADGTERFYRVRRW